MTVNEQIDFLTKSTAPTAVRIRGLTKLYFSLTRSEATENANRIMIAIESLATAEMVAALG